MLLVSALVASTCSVLFTSRRVIEDGAFTTEAVAADGGSAAFVRNLVQGLAFLIVLGLAAECVRKRRWRLAGPRRRLLLALAAFPLAVLPSYVLGAEGSTRNLANLLGFLLLLLAVHGLPPVDTRWLFGLFKRTLLVFLYGSLAAALVAPEWALQRGYDQGLLASLPFRLHGLAFHANALAPLAAIYLMLWRWRPARLPFDTVHAIAAAIVLLLSQSKTVWLGLAAAWAILQLHDRIVWNGARLAAALGTLALLGSAIVLLELTGAGPMTAALDFVGSHEELLTLTGRLAIWGATLLVWQEHKWFGYGPELWGEGMQEQLLPLTGWTFGHAHSFYFQALGQAGIVGVAGAMTLLAGLARASWRSRGAFGGAVLAICVIVLLRTVAEPTFTNRIAWSPDVILIVLVFAIEGRSPARRTRHVPSRPPTTYRIAMKPSLALSPSASPTPALALESRHA